MRLRYLHVTNYPPIADLTVCFASGSPLKRDCAIRFVVGINGSGKSNLLRAVAEVFLALADERLPPFPVSLVYELGRRGTSDHYTFLIDCPGTKSEASIWVASGFFWPDDTQQVQFEKAVELMRSSQGLEGFTALVRSGTWPQSPSIAMPKAVLAYTTGDLRPWRSVWARDQEALGLLQNSEMDSSDERPAGWTAQLEAALQAARQEAGESRPLEPQRARADTETFRRPILLDATLLKCALLAVALPQSLKTREGQRATLQAMLERGGWHDFAAVAFRARIQPTGWKRKVCETAYDWWLCAGEVISEPHPIEARRTLYFDINESFNRSDQAARTSNEALAACKTQGEALLALLGGTGATAFELFARLLELNQAELFDDVFLRLRRQTLPEPGTDGADQDIGVLRFEELSDGEQMVLGRMALFHLLQDQQDALLLLDEPETHFNDKWKREIVDIIDDAIGDTTNDVLIATHSAIVLSDVFNNEIVMLQKTDSGSGIRTVDTPTFATDPSALMMTVFGAEDSIGKRAQEFIERTLQEHDGTPDQIKQLEQLISRMGSGFYRSELRTLLNTLQG